VLHRDLKPSNILVKSDGAVRVLDFGIAKLLEDDTHSDEALTREAGAGLTPKYAAPEQIEGKTLDGRADVAQGQQQLGERTAQTGRESPILKLHIITEACPHWLDRLAIGRGPAA
jgi:serine/threonine protein kinase